jgi:transmembrane sensor
VLEGRVRVVTQLQDQPGLAAPVNPGIQDLEAGEEAEVAPTGRIHKRALPDVVRAAAWQRKSLKFQETPLANIVAEINRYSALKLRLEDAQIGRRRYGGIFDGTDPESLAAVLEREPDLVVERRKDEIVVRRR